VKILFDQGTPAPLRRELSKHTVTTAFEKSWSTLTNGDLLKMAEREFDLLITTDQNLEYQQNIAGRRIALLILPTTRWPEIKLDAAEIAFAVGQTKPGSYLSLVW